MGEITCTPDTSNLMLLAECACNASKDVGYFNILKRLGITKKEKVGGLLVIVYDETWRTWDMIFKFSELRIDQGVEEYCGSKQLETQDVPLHLQIWLEWQACFAFRSE
ncbi:hypothetical protein AMTRI_Chr09g21690 [Amborella trichopoda]